MSIERQGAVVARPLGELRELHPVPRNFEAFIITDCEDPNANLRQKMYFHKLFGVKPDLVGVGDGPSADLQAGLNLVDGLDARRRPRINGSFLEPTTAAILVNVAPRGDAVRKKHANGTPFCHYEQYGTRVFSTFDGRALQIAAWLGAARREVEVLDTAEAVDRLLDIGLISDRPSAEEIKQTQFRSKDFLQLAARAIIGGVSLPSEKRAIDYDEEDIQDRVIGRDNFGNLVIARSADEIEFSDESSNGVPKIKLARRRFWLPRKEATCIESLADVPTGKLAIVRGSSGYGQTRLATAVVGRGSAAKKTGFDVGDKIFESR